MRLSDSSLRFLARVVAVMAATAIAIAAPRPAGRLAPGPLVVEVVSAVDDKPLADTIVRLGGRYAATGSDGKLTLDGVPAGAYRLTIEQSGFDRLTQEVNLPDGRRDDLKIVLTPTRLWAVEGRVIEQDTRGPLAGARLAFIPVEVVAAQKGRYDLTADFQGKFAIQEVPPGKYQVEASAYGCADKTFDVEIHASPAAIELTLQRVKQDVSLTVRVLDAVTGAGIQGARVTVAECWPTGRMADATAGGGGTASFPNLKLSRINWADDRGMLSASRRLVTVHAEAAGHQPSAVPVDLARGAQVEIRLDPTQTIDEQEPNDSIGAPQEIHPGTTVRLTISKPADRDFFKFRAPMPGHLKLTLGGDSGIETLLRLYDGEAKRIAERGVGAGSENVIEADVLAGDFVASVEEWGNNNCSAKPMPLEVRFTPVFDPAEPLDAEGRLIRIGEETRGLIYPLGDVDRYRFEIGRPAHVRLTLGANNIERLVRLIDSEGKSAGDVGVGPGQPAQADPGSRRAVWNDDFSDGRFRSLCCSRPDPGRPPRPGHRPDRDAAAPAHGRRQGRGGGRRRTRLTGQYGCPPRGSADRHPGAPGVGRQQLLPLSLHRLDELRAVRRDGVRGA
ncbi:MAG: carboxypeptidase regulatory-like domain-containing protein [Candidatus Wallbacteria bacterium]|nr:carboxypeptidase regulatory-like domain-containing protein [Candidatus Wallbacteria bacterium]